MKSWIQIIGTNTVDVTPSIVVHFDTQRYLFNCGEGTQRLFVEKSVKYGKLQNVFCTRVQWECVGGLPGMLLTVSDAGLNKLTVHGGRNLTHFLVATRHFVYRSTMQVETNEMTQVPYQDENLTVHPVILAPTVTQPAVMVRKRSSDEREKEIRAKLLKTMFGSALQKATETTCEGAKLENKLTEQELRHLPRVQPSQDVVCYACHGPDVRGKFDAKAAMALGLKPGKEYRELTEGKSVVAPDGRTIHPDQVMGPSKTGSIFIVVDCPSIDYIPSLMKHPVMELYRQGITQGNVGGAPQCVIHLAGNGVLENEAYREWMTSFPPTTKHIVDSKEYNAQQMQFNASASSQAKLSLLDAQVFPLAFHDKAEKEWSSLGLDERFVQSEPLLMFQMEPIAKMDRSAVLEPFSHNVEMEKGRQLPRYSKMVDALQQTPPQKDLFASTMITTLGTGSAVPSKYRNVSGNMLTVPHVGTMILDAGEGTFGQLYRHLGPEIHTADWFTNPYLPFSLEDCLRQLTFIFVSHLHADHHLGIVRLLIEWNKLQRADEVNRNIQRTSTITMIAPQRFYTWLQEYAQVEDIGLEWIDFYGAHDCLYYAATNHIPQHILTSLNLTNISTTEVIHCPYAYAISLTSKDGWKFVYSGDTRPCDKLVELGKGATLLLHEATFEDDMKEEAIEKRHSTTGEAIQVAQQSHAQSLLLTHFSQRYPRVPILTKQSIKQQPTSIAFDLMTVPLHQVNNLTRYLPSLVALTQEDKYEPDEP